MIKYTMKSLYMLSKTMSIYSAIKTGKNVTIRPLAVRQLWIGRIRYGERAKKRDESKKETYF